MKLDIIIRLTFDFDLNVIKLEMLNLFLHQIVIFFPHPSNYFASECPDIVRIWRNQTESHA